MTMFIRFAITKSITCLVLCLSWFAKDILGAGTVTEMAIPLGGQWRFAMDQPDVGVNQQWFTSNLSDQIIQPGILQAQGYGDEISTNTPWVLTLHDPFWYLRDEYNA